MIWRLHTLYVHTGGNFPTFVTRTAFDTTCLLLGFTPLDVQLNFATLETKPVWDIIESITAKETTMLIKSRVLSTRLLQSEGTACKRGLEVVVAAAAVAAAAAAASAPALDRRGL